MKHHSLFHTFLLENQDDTHVEIVCIVLMRWMKRGPWENKREGHLAARFPSTIKSGRYRAK